MNRAWLPLVCLSSCCLSLQGLQLPQPGPSGEGSTVPSEVAVQVGLGADPADSWKCLTVRRSTIPSAGQGLFATCNLTSHVLLGEYLGERFVMGERGANQRLASDWAYTWKVPRCKAAKSAPVAIGRMDKHLAHSCSDASGYVYVDAKPMEHGNPLRFVNGAHDATEQELLNVEVFFADDRVWYYTSRNVSAGSELFTNYGKKYWEQKKAPGSTQQELEVDWGDFMSDG
mmetsp:Transcript_11014/g.19966  ORF Transcript_11014/g.19966 Transcript_11014/m.19966 type:complete len:229 (+) Transcript_11014:69-755(+)